MTQQNQPTTKIQVDDKVYTVQFYDPEYGLTLWAELLQAAGPSIVSFVSSFKGKKLEELSLKDVDLDKIGEGLIGLLRSVPPAELVPLMKKILCQTYMTELSHHNDRVVDQMNTDVFRGKYLHLLKMTAKTLGAQYPDFLSGIVRGVKGIKTAQGEKKAVQK